MQTVAASPLPAAPPSQNANAILRKDTILKNQSASIVAHQSAADKHRAKRRASQALAAAGGTGSETVNPASFKLKMPKEILVNSARRSDEFKKEAAIKAGKKSTDTTFMSSIFAVAVMCAGGAYFALESNGVALDTFLALVAGRVTDKQDGKVVDMDNYFKGVEVIKSDGNVEEFVKFQPLWLQRER